MPNRSPWSAKTPVVAGARHGVLAAGQRGHRPAGSGMTLQAPSTDGRQNWLGGGGDAARASPRSNLGSKKGLCSCRIAGKGDAAQPVSTRRLRVRRVGAEGQQLRQGVRRRTARTRQFDTRWTRRQSPPRSSMFRTNHRLVVLNDVVNGNVWNPQESTKVIKIQWNKVETKQSKQQEQNNDSANNQHNFSKNLLGAVGADQGRGRFVRRARGIAADPRRACATTSRPTVPCCASRR